MQSWNGCGNVIDWLIKTNQDYSKIYVAQQEPRRIHRMLYPTKISVYKCSDERCDFTGMTEAPPGIIDPFRNIGGKFDLQWSLFQRVVHDSKMHADSERCHSLAITTYHYDRKFKHLGCAGHNCDLESARKCCLDLRDQFNRIYGGPKNQGRTRLFALSFGIDTHYQALVLHGEDGQTADLSEVSISGESAEQTMAFLATLYPRTFPRAPNVFRDLVPLIQGNIRHSRKVKRSNLPVEELGHTAFTMAYGRGFYWLPPKSAIMVGPWERSLAPLRVAATVINDNFRKRIIETPVLLTSGIFREQGAEEDLAIEKALGLRKTAIDEVIKPEFPELYHNLKTIVTAVNLDNREFQVIDRSH